MSAAGRATGRSRAPRAFGGAPPTRRPERPGPAGPAGGPGAILRAMKLSQLLFVTLKEEPADAEVRSHALMARAGAERVAHARSLRSEAELLSFFGPALALGMQEIVREGSKYGAKLDVFEYE